MKKKERENNRSTLITLSKSPSSEKACRSVGLLEPPTELQTQPERKKRERERETHEHAWWQVRSWVAVALVVAGKRWWVELLAEKSIIDNRQDGASNVDEDNRATHTTTLFSLSFSVKSQHIYPCVCVCYFPSFF